MSVRVFAINDYEWWAGDGTTEEMLQAYMAHTGCSHEEATGDEEDWPVPVSEQGLDQLKFVHDEDGNLLETPISFRQYLAELIENGAQFPCFFAATDW